VSSESLFAILTYPPEDPGGRPGKREELKKGGTLPLSLCLNIGKEVGSGYMRFGDLASGTASRRKMASARGRKKNLAVLGE